MQGVLEAIDIPRFDIVDHCIHIDRKIKRNRSYRDCHFADFERHWSLLQWQNQPVKWFCFSSGTISYISLGIDRDFYALVVLIWLRKWRLIPYHNFLEIPFDWEAPVLLRQRWDKEKPSVVTNSTLEPSKVRESRICRRRLVVDFPTATSLKPPMIKVGVPSFLKKNTPFWERPNLLWNLVDSIRFVKGQVDVTYILEVDAVVKTFNKNELCLRERWGGFAVTNFAHVSRLIFQNVEILCPYVLYCSLWYTNF